jgi:adenine phosphoribosyltransferase
MKAGQRVLIVDDVLATGGTASAAVRLVKRLGGELHGLAFLIELEALKGKGLLAGEKVYSVLKY